jgi:hypothetical protein
VPRKTKKRSFQIPEEVITRTAKMVAAGKCLGCHCELTAKRRPTRGLCQSCYNAAMHQVSKGLLTNEQLILAGKILLPRKGRAQKVTWVKELV